MGTRNVTQVILNGELKVDQYGQWDGYPSGVGLGVLEFLSTVDMDKFREKVAKLIPLKSIPNNIRIIDGAVHNAYSRDTADGILTMIMNDEIPGNKTQITDGFINDHLFCEGAYIIDLDKNEFQVRNWAKADYKLSELPTKEDFLNELEPKEE